MNNLTYIMDNPNLERESDGYEHLEAGIRKSFEEAIATGEPLFTTNIDNLYDIFLENIPEEGRQHYNCHTCRNFVNRYGGLVTINEYGHTKPIMWDFECPEFFKAAVAKIHARIRFAKVNGVFITEEKRLGIPKTGVWTHMAVDVPKSMLHRDRLNTAYQKASAKNEEFHMLLRAVLKYDIRTIETAVNLLRSESMYRGEKILGIAEWFLDTKKAVQIDKKAINHNLLWKLAVTAPTGFCHVSSSMIGTLLDDIQDGYDFQAVKNRFNEKMNPLKYQRPQVAPGSGNVKRAEEIVAKLGLENSLKRRFARLDEIQTIWKPASVVPKTANVGGGIFANLKTKNEPAKKVNDLTADYTTMTWEKFQRTVLPMAKKIEFLVGSTNSYAALVTAEDMDAPSIIQWDTEENRNPVNWYLYNGGSFPSKWNLQKGWTEVTAIALQPNMWQEGYEHQGQGVFFILKDCKDTQNRSSALFPETLRGELREVRATMEQYSRTTPLGGVDEASACGLLLQGGTGRTWLNGFRVTTDVGRSLYRLDRWD